MMTTPLSIRWWQEVRQRRAKLSALVTKLSVLVKQANSMVAGGPAAKSKAISVGDKIVGVGQTGKPMVDVICWRLDDVVALIKGPTGSKVRLEILPAG